MKYTEIINRLNSLENKLGFNPNNIEQGSEQWLKMKLGVISASKAKELLSGSKTATKRTFIATLVAQIATGMAQEIKAKQLAWGNENEDAARSAYEFSNGLKVLEVPFIYGDETLRFGISPDGLIVKDDAIVKGWENKCPFDPTNFVKFVCDETIKKEHEKQCQFSMFVTGADLWDYSNYEPRAKSKQLHTITFERDEKMMTLFKEAIQEVNHEVDLMLEKLGLSFGDQWNVAQEIAA